MRRAMNLGGENGALRFSISDDGAGFDLKAHPLGAGLQNMADRLDSRTATIYAGVAAI